MAALFALLRQQQRQADWRDYTAEVMWSIGRRMYKEYPLPSWLEMTADKPQQDERSGREIFNEVRTNLRKRVAAREAV